MRVSSWSVTRRCSSVIAARFKRTSGLLALAATMTLGSSACIHTQEEERSDAPPPASTAVADTSQKGPSRAPSASDVPAKYVITSWNASLWAPTLRSDCANRLPSRLHPRRQEGRFFVYFSCATTGSGPLAAAARILPNQSASIQGALSVLFRGPTAAERRAGYRATFGAATSHLPFKVAVDRGHQLAIVDLDRRFLEVEFLFVPTDDVAHIVSVAGQFPGIEWVAILVDGQPLCKALREC